MFKHLIALVLVALAAAFVSPAVAQQPPGTSVGTLACNMAPSIGLIFGSRQRMACRFTPNGPVPLRNMLVLWAQLVSMSESRQGGHGVGRICTHRRSETRSSCRHLCGCERRDWRGCWGWCQPLFGGTGRSIALQPLSVEGSVGVNLSLGVSSLTLSLAQ
jgi:Protein of unknown function (DUF992).